MEVPYYEIFSTLSPENILHSTNVSNTPNSCFFMEGVKSKFRNQHKMVKILIFHTVILMLLDRRQRQTMGLHNCIAACIFLNSNTSFRDRTPQIWTHTSVSTTRTTIIGAEWDFVLLSKLIFWRNTNCIFQFPLAT
jgi:hypothetical protein